MSQESSIFHDIIGHEAAVRLLERWVERPAQAYLLYGPAHVGKRTIAERFVQELLAEPATTVNRAHPDLLIVEAEEGKQMIAVETVRDVRSRLYQRPMRAPRMVVYIPHADRMNEEGTNAFLKMVEEPPAGAVFVFVAEDSSRLPATIHSRVVHLALTHVSASELANALLARGMSREDAEKNARLSRGRPGIALSDSEDFRPHRDAVRFFSAPTTGERLECIDRLAKECESTEDTLSAWRSVLEEMSEACRAELGARPVPALVLGQAVAMALRSLGGPLSPRVYLDIGAARLEDVERDPALLSRLLCAQGASSMPMIFAHYA